jgi:hypothetical protein
MTSRALISPVQRNKDMMKENNGKNDEIIITKRFWYVVRTKAGEQVCFSYRTLLRGQVLANPHLTGLKAPTFQIYSLCLPVIENPIALISIISQMGYQPSYAGYCNDGCYTSCDNG